MTDQPPLTPPERAPEVAASQPIPPVPPVTPPAAYAPPSYPPPTYAQQYPSPQYGATYPPTYPHYAPPPRTIMSTRARVLMIVGIVAGSSLLLGGAIAGGIALGNSFEPLNLEANEEDEVEVDPNAGIPGAPGGPLECPEECFYPSDASLMKPASSDLAALGTKEALPDWGSDYQTTIVSEYPYAVGDWNSQHGSPSECFFTLPAAPIAESFGETPNASNGYIVYTAGGQSPGGYSIWTQAVRTFTTSQLAAEHIDAIESLVLGCPHYESDGWAATLDLAPDLELPQGVRAVGWIETGDEYGQYLVYDLARGNMVVRNVYSTGTNSGLTRFVTFVEKQADLLAGLVIENTPIAKPTGCEGACIDATQAATLALDATTTAPLGALSATAPPPLASTLGDAEVAARSIFAAGEGDPYTCYFGLSRTPINPLQDIFTELDAPTIELGMWASPATSVTQSALVFQSELYASRHPGFLNSPIKQCAEYSYEADGVLHEVTVTGTKFDTGEVASAGWTETEGSTTRTFADLQYRNLVLRIVIERAPDSTVTDEQIAQYVQSEAARMAALAG